MMTRKNRNRNQLGRHLGKQGPRQAVGHQAASAKSDTGNTTNTLHIFQANINGLSDKKTELAHYLDQKDVHIALLQETMLGQNSDPHISGYTPYPCKCPNACQGVITYIRNDVQGKVENITNCQPTDIQKATIWFSGCKYTVYNIYSPSNSKCSFSFLTDSTYTKTVLAGDFNGHSPQWGYKQGWRLTKFRPSQPG